MKKARLGDNGFTLIEIMVSMVISSLVIAGIYGVYTIQQRSYTVQEQVSEMQQRIRGAVDYMARNIRMAGYDPNGLGCDSDLTTTAPSTLEFDICDETDKREFTIAYDKTEGDINVTTVLNGGTGSTMPLAEGVDAFLFRYLDSQGNVATGNNITVVEISMLVRSSAPDFKHTDTMTYVPGSGDPADWKKATNFDNPSTNSPNKNFHRRLLITSIAMRNM
ncbi:prepilin-type N-terminal cleavage/methylation domain-containing protein [Candidatus Electrothrix sp.]|uniref:prepilin-type N-terminal cleavage/methylation domain-containing protein n=1 Tax=Candidatus Electrothrix sp. TaxID=2170559 RepID=UPI004057B8B2